MCPDRLTWAIRCALSLFALILVECCPAHAETPDRPITFSVRSGVLSADGLLDVRDGWHPVVNVDLRTDLQPWIGHYLDFTIAPVRLGEFREYPRFFTVGVVATLPSPLRSTTLSYKIGYGAIFTGRMESALFAHSLLLSYMPTRRWRMEVEGRQLVPNDWFADLGLSERYSSFSVALGWGVSF